MLLSAPILALTLVGACKDKEGPSLEGTDTGDTGGGYISETTGVWTEDGGTVTEDGGTPTDGGTEETTPTEPDDPYVTALDLYPSSMVVAPEATWTMRLLATWDDGSRSEADVTWTSSDEAVVTVDAAGVVTAVAAGTAELTASRDEVSASVPVEVRDDGLITIKVVDRETGKVHPGARVRIGTDGAEGETGEDGLITLKHTEPGPFMVTAWTHYRVPMTVAGALNRELVLPLTSTDLVAPDFGSLEGSVDLSEVPSGGGGDLKVGFVAPTLSNTPLIIKEELLLGPPREVSFYGIATMIPANVFIRDAAEDYSVPAPEGTTGAWTIAAPIYIGDITSGLAGATDAISIILEDLDKIAWGWTEGATLAPGEVATADLAPATALTEVITVDAGPLPVGFSGDEDIMVMLGDMLPEHGFTTVGLGIGTFEVEVSVADVALSGSTGRYAAAVAQVGGLGSGSGAGICTAWAPADGDEVVLPELQQVPAISSWDGETMWLTGQTDSRARFVHVTVAGSRAGMYHELVLDGGPFELEVPNLGSPFGWANSEWELLAFELRDGTFHDLVRDGWPTDRDLAHASHSSGLLDVKP